MIVSLDNAYRPECLFLPARNNTDKLIGLEIIANFVGVGSGVRTPTELITRYMTPEEELSLFKEKLALLETCQLFFIQHHLLAWINISSVIVQALLTETALIESVKRFPFLEFTINENYPGLNTLNEHHALVILAKRFNLVLANFGAGDASTKAIFAGIFSRIAIDKTFVQRRVLSPSFEPFMRAIVAQVLPHCATMMIAGVDNEETRRRVEPFGFSAMQGALWPAVTVSRITTLVQG
ncbi:EAL domain-containing protein [Trabulsiella odontotermitis]|uniref:EAL domain-containing protein n=1 Tax=Trabulsiella odontotermitis TaxID=379893 RepID=UPI0006BA64AD|nr:EAL domain-containing protein [Trabulsiella odontotermitis]